MRINHNIAALNTYRQLGNANAGQMKSMEKLSSGLRINRAGDDAAGLAISEKMRGQIRGMEQASRNAQDGISLIQTAEGALNETHSILQRMRELGVQASNETYNTDDISSIQKELDNLIDEIDNIGGKTKFNNKNLLDGSATSINLAIGANDESLTITINDMRADALGVTDTLDTFKTGGASELFTAEAAGPPVVPASANTANAGKMIVALDEAIKQVSDERAELGAKQNRLEHTINNLGTAGENLTAAESRVRDVDMAKEMMEQTKNSILAQASQAMLAQSQQTPQGVLQLLR